MTQRFGELHYHEIVFRNTQANFIGQYSTYSISVRAVVLVVKSPIGLLVDLTTCALFKFWTV